MTRSDPVGIRIVGKKWELVATVYDANGALLALNTATVTVTLKGDTTTVTKTASDGGSTGKVVAVFLPADTTTLSSPTTGKVQYQVDVSFDPDNTDTVAFGYFYVRPSLS